VASRTLDSDEDSHTERSACSDNNGLVSLAKVEAVDRSRLGFLA